MRGLERRIAGLERIAPRPPDPRLAEVDEQIRATFGMSLSEFTDAELMRLEEFVETAPPDADTATMLRFVFGGPALPRVP